MLIYPSLKIVLQLFKRVVFFMKGKTKEYRGKWAGDVAQVVPSVPGILKAWV